MSLLLTAVLTAALSTAVAAPASAHNSLRSTAPADGTRLSAPPPQVSLTFDEDVIAVGTEIAVSGPAGPVDAAPPQVSGPTASAALPPDLPGGAYTVQWRVTSVDGHPISGTFGFTVEAAAATAAPAPTATATDAPATDTPTAAPRAGDDAAAGSGGIPLPVLLVLGALVVAALAAGLLLRRRQG